MIARKPKAVEIGSAYHMYRPACLELGDIAVVTSIDQVTKATRIVRYELLNRDQGGRATNYSDFMQRVHSVARLALN